MENTETTGKGLVDHWTWAANKGLVNSNTASALKAACSQVLSIDENWESHDIQKLDIEAMLTRFQNLRKEKFKPESLNTYKRRFKQAVASYLSYVKNPGGWKPKTRERTERQEQNSEKTVRHGAPEIRELHIKGNDGSFVSYPFPIRENQIAHLSLPKDLKSNEVKRLAAFLSSLAVDFETTNS
jgi:hypothetical protein